MSNRAVRCHECLAYTLAPFCAAGLTNTRGRIVCIRVLRIGDWHSLATKPLGTLKCPLSEFYTNFAELAYTRPLDV